jgi:catechol 2,3-dioxygenase-like lactoylglutathione lyase family enzyme
MKLGGALTLAAAVFLAGLSFAQAQPPAIPKTPVVVTLDSFGVVVADLDRSVAFYRDVLGLTLITPITSTTDPASLRVGATEGATLRYARLQIPNEPYAIELDEYSGIDRKAGKANHNDPGSSFLNFGYQDVSVPFAALRAANAATLGERPIPANIAKGRMIGVWIRDPDGTMIEVMQGGWDPERKSLVGVKNLYRSHFGMTMQDHLDALTFYRDLLGFDLYDGFPPMVEAGKFESARGISGAIGVPATANWTGIAGHCAYARCEMFEFKDAPRTAFKPRMQDPGAAYLSMWVNDLDGLLAKITAAKLEIATPGGRPVTVTRQRGATMIPGPINPRDNASPPVPVTTSREILVRDPAGFLILLKQRVS